MTVCIWISGLTGHQVSKWLLFKHEMTVARAQGSGPQGWRAVTGFESHLAEMDVTGGGLMGLPISGSGSRVMGSRAFL